MKFLHFVLLTWLLLAAFVVQAVPVKPGEDATFRHTKREIGDKTSSVTFIHTNDIHSHIDEFDDEYTRCPDSAKAANACFGGMARMKTTIDRIRKETPHPTLLVDAGDQFQGTMYYSHYNGNVTAEVMNRLKYDVMALGNHEFVDKVLNLERVASMFKFPLVCANVNLTAHPQLNQLVKPYIILEHLSVGIIGVITPTTGEALQPGDDVIFFQPIPIVQKFVSELNRKGIKRIVVLSHIGYREDLELAAATSGVSLIIGGHSHTSLRKQGPVEAGMQGYYPTNVTNFQGKPTFVVQAGYAGEYIGNITLTWNVHDELVDINGGSILLDGSVPEDPEMDKFTREMGEPFREHASQQIGNSTARWDRVDCRNPAGQCSLGNLINDAILTTYREIDFVMISAGGIRASLRKGLITQSDIEGILPFGDRVVSNVVKGQYILDVLENAFAFKNRDSNKRIRNPHLFAGGRVVIDSSRPAFQRVVSVEYRDRRIDSPVKQLDPNMDYVFGMAEFIAGGGESIVPKKFSSPKSYGTLVEALGRHLKHNYHVTPYMDSRVVDIGNATKAHR